MPKKLSNITKSQRIDALRKILTRWGRLDKNQINEHLAAHLDIDIDSVSRNIYRDLDELVNSNEIKVFYFTRDGVAIDEYDQEIHKNTFCQWAMVGNESQILGQDILKKNGALILASEQRLSKYLRIDQGNSIEFRYLNIFFHIPNHFLSLKISKEAYPFDLIIGRLPQSDPQGLTIFSELEKKYGKRVVLLSIPESSVSSFKPNEGKLGHTHIRFDMIDGKEVITIHDLASKNKTFTCKLSQIEADSIRSQGLDSQKNTITDGFDLLKTKDPILKLIEVKKETLQQSPFLVFTSEQVPFLVV